MTKNYGRKDKKRGLMPPFREVNYERYADVFIKNTEKMLAGWDHYAETGEPVNFDAMIVNLTLENLLNTLFTNVSFDIPHFSHALRAWLFLRSKKVSNLSLAGAGKCQSLYNLKPVA